MNLLVSLILSILVLLALAGYWRYRWRFMLLASAVLFLALLAYNSVRAFAYLALNQHYLAELASTHPELHGYIFNPEQMVSDPNLSLRFNQANGYYDEITKITSNHPWSKFTGFTVSSVWLTKKNIVVFVSYVPRGDESEYFSGFTWGPDQIGRSEVLILKDTLMEYRNDE